jgi:hypothetical protein
MGKGTNTNTVGAVANYRDILPKKRAVPHFKRWKVVDPYNRLLVQKYRVASRNTATSHEEYGELS